MAVFPGFLVEILFKVTEAVVGGVLKWVAVIAKVLEDEITWPIETLRVVKKLVVFAVHDVVDREPPLRPTLHVGAAEEKYG